MAFYLKPNCILLVWKRDFRQVIEFVLLRTTCSFTVLNKSYKHDLMQPKEVVLWGFIYSPSVTNKAWKHYSLQVIKFVYMHSSYFLSVLNMVLHITCTKFWNSCICTLSMQYMNSKHDSRLLMKYVYRFSTFSFSH